MRAAGGSTGLIYWKASLTSEELSYRILQTESAPPQRLSRTTLVMGQELLVLSDETGPANLPMLVKGAAVLPSLFWVICLTLSTLQVTDQGFEHSALNWSMSTHAAGETIGKRRKSKKPVDFLRRVSH